MNFVDPRTFKHPVIGQDVTIYPLSIFGMQPQATAANRRAVTEWDVGSIGARSIIGARVTLYAGVHIGEDCRLGDSVIIREGTKIGDRCAIGTNVDIQYECTIGDDVRILNETQIAGGTVIGEGTFIGPGVQTANDPHVARFPLTDYVDRGQVAPWIGRHVFIGVGAIILPGVKIGDGALIAAGTIVTRDVAAGVAVMNIKQRRDIAG
jgi:acetyltransferase-like isoleucine patch superfamily enzyme